MGIKDIDSLTIDDIKPLTVSFKKDEDDLVLYKWVLRKCRSGKSGYIKDRLREIKEAEEGKRDAKTEKISYEVKEKGLIDMDF